MQAAGPDVRRGWGGSGDEELEDPSEEEEDDDEESESIDPLDRLKDPRPDTAKRRCTDPFWLLAFLVFQVGLAYILWFGNEFGDKRRLWTLRDARGELCGLGAEARTNLFFCLDASNPELVDTSHPLCVDECPKSKNETRACLRSSTKTNDTIEDVMPAYPTVPAIGLICKPVNSSLAVQVYEWQWQNAPVSVVAKMLRVAWLPLAVCAPMAVVISYLYIYMVRDFASALVRTGIAMSIALPILWGLLFFVRWWESDVPQEKERCLVYGVIFTTIGLIPLCIVCVCDTHLEKAMDCIEWSGTCILEMPALRLGPLVILVLRWSITLVIVLLGADLISIGWYPSQNKRLTYPWQEYVYIAYFVFDVFWIQCVFSACSDFVVAYISELWYVEGGMAEERVDVSLCRQFKAVWVLLRYHLGTIIFGGLVVGLAYPFRVSLLALTAPGRVKPNPLACIAEAVCLCVIDVYDDYLKPLCKNAYMDTAMYGHSFHKAALQSVEIVNTQTPTIHILSGGTWLFQVAGFSIVAGAGYFLTYAILLGEVFGQYMSAESASYVQEPKLWCILGAMVAILTAASFMVMLDTVSDTVLYSFTVMKLRKARQRQYKGGSWNNRSCSNSLAELLGAGLGCGSWTVDPEPSRPAFARKPPSQRSLVVRQGKTPSGGTGKWRPGNGPPSMRQPQ